VCPLLPSIASFPELPALSSLTPLSALVAVSLAACLSTGCSRPADAAASGERAAVGATLEVYFKAHATGDGTHIRRAFHPDAKIQSIKEGKLAASSRDEFAARFSGKPAADEARRKRRILSIDIAGDAAVAKVELDYPDVHFIDYMSLLKLDGSWVIMNKIFHRGEPTGAATK
jgi:Putative lumazine-binding